MASKDDALIDDKYFTNAFESLTILCDLMKDLDRLEIKGYVVKRKDLLTYLEIIMFQFKDQYNLPNYKKIKNEREEQYFKINMNILKVLVNKHEE